MFEKIEEKYGLLINKIEKSVDSTDGNVYMLYSSCKYVMKIYDSKEHVLSIVKLHNDLNRMEIKVPEVILTKNQESYISLEKDQYIVIFSFLKGNEIGKVFGDIDEVLSIKIARELKKIHKLSCEGNVYNLKEVPFDVNKKIKRYCVLHFDLTKSNVFFNKQWDNEIGFIDFDDAKYGPAIVDVAIAISLLYLSKSRGVNKNGILAFINEYYNDIDEKQEEVPFIKEIVFSWIEYILNNNYFDTSTNESFEVKKKLIDEIDFL